MRLPDASDVAAWDEFVAIYAPLVYRLAQKRGLQPSGADDLIQEVLTSVAQSVRDWLDRSDRGPFRAWLFRIAKNAAVNLLMRRATRTMATGGSESANHFAGIAASTEDEQFELEYRREIFRFAAACVRDTVSDATWQAFWLTHVEGVSIQDAARQLNQAVGNIYVSRSRVMARLRVFVSEFEADQ